MLDVSTPIVVGLAGKAGTGKTTIARTIVPTAREAPTQGSLLYWDHLFLSMPLYGLATIKRKTEGVDSQNRISHLVHENLYDVFKASSLPDYSTMTKLVNYIVEYELPYDLEEKPRTFLQEVGSLMRALNEDCFAQYLRQKTLTNFVTYNNTEPDQALKYKTIKDVVLDSVGRGWTVKDTTDTILSEIDGLTPVLPTFVTVISDVRYPNEAEMINKFPNGILIKLDCEDMVRKERLLERDGKLLSDEQASHNSETSVDEIPEELITTHLDTTQLSIEDQALDTINIVKGIL